MKQRVLFLSGLYFVLGMAMISLGQANGLAQGQPTPTPGSLLVIPTATPAIPAPDVDALSAPLDTYGLRPGDVAGFNPVRDNGTSSFEKAVEAFAAAFPDRQLFIRALGELYRTYGVTEQNTTTFLAPSCEGQPIFSVGTWIRRAESKEKAEALMADPALPGLYQGAFNYVETTLNVPAAGKSLHYYQAAAPKGFCNDTPTTGYIVEYNSGNLIIAVRVYAPDSTARNLIEGVLANIINIVEQRTQGGGTSAVESPPQLPAGQVPFAASDDPTRLNPVFTWVQNVSPASAYDLIPARSSLALTAGPNTALERMLPSSAPVLIYPVTGDFDASVRIGARSMQAGGAGIALRSIQDGSLWVKLAWRKTIERVTAEARTEANGAYTGSSYEHQGAAVYLKIERRGSTFNLYYGSDGKTWKATKEWVVPNIAREVQFLLFAESYDKTNLIAEFSEFTVAAR